MRKFGIAARAIHPWEPVGVGVPSIVKRSLLFALLMIATGVLTCLQYHLRIPIVRTRQFDSSAVSHFPYKRHAKANRWNCTVRNTRQNQIAEVPADTVPQLNGTFEGRLS